jgi:hypothetical protein
LRREAVRKRGVKGRERQDYLGAFTVHNGDRIASLPHVNAMEVLLRARCSGSIAVLEDEPEACLDETTPELFD